MAKKKTRTGTIAKPVADALDDGFQEQVRSLYRVYLTSRLTVQSDEELDAVGQRYQAGLAMAERALAECKQLSKRAR